MKPPPTIAPPPPAFGTAPPTLYFVLHALPGERRVCVHQDHQEQRFEARIYRGLRQFNKKIKDHIEKTEVELNRINEKIKLNIEEALKEYLFKYLEKDALLEMLDMRFKKVYQRQQIHRVCAEAIWL